MKLGRVGKVAEVGSVAVLDSSGELEVETATDSDTLSLLSSSSNNCNTCSTVSVAIFTLKKTHKYPVEIPAVNVFHRQILAPIVNHSSSRIATVSIKAELFVLYALAKE